MSEAVEQFVPLPLDGTDHYHTGCFHVECSLPGGLVLWLLGGSPYPRAAANGRLAVRRGQSLGGWVRSAEAKVGYDQDALKRSGSLNGLDVTWAEAAWAGGSWFQFRAEPELLSELANRLRRFAEQKHAEPKVAPDCGGIT